MWQKECSKMGTIYCIEYGVMDDTTESCIWESLENGYFETKYLAEEFLANEAYERDYDNIYFKHELDKGSTVVARIRAFNKL